MIYVFIIDKTNHKAKAAYGQHPIQSSDNKITHIKNVNIT